MWRPCERRSRVRRRMLLLTSWTVLPRSPFPAALLAKAGLELLPPKARPTSPRMAQGASGAAALRPTPRARARPLLLAQRGSSGRRAPAVEAAPEAQALRAAGSPRSALAEAAPRPWRAPGGGHRRRARRSPRPRPASPRSSGWWRSRAWPWRARGCLCAASIGATGGHRAAAGPRQGRPRSRASSLAVRRLRGSCRTSWRRPQCPVRGRWPRSNAPCAAGGTARPGIPALCGQQPWPTWPAWQATRALGAPLACQRQRHPPGQRGRSGPRGATGASLRPWRTVEQQPLVFAASRPWRARSGALSGFAAA
mmetsp:Transcript_89246/g.288968  ORF Transcript_89246/g.288968 Transcript_89246/m.288968 type:complete len:310 (-) Transcript_89246:42-971(-)